MWNVGDKIRSTLGNVYTITDISPSGMVHARLDEAPNDKVKRTYLGKTYPCPIRALDEYGYERLSAGPTPPVLIPLKSFIDSDLGIEWLPLRALGWPKRAVIIRYTDSGVLSQQIEQAEKRIQHIEVYHQAPIRTLTPTQPLELLRQELAALL